MDTDVRWFSMPLSAQISNIGSEVHRAIQWKNRNNKERAVSFCDKAIEFLNVIKKDPKNKYRVDEFDEAIFELDDYFKGENTYHTRDEVLIAYYDAFLYLE